MSRHDRLNQLSGPEMEKSWEKRISPNETAMLIAQVIKIKFLIGRGVNSGPILKSEVV